MGGEIFIRPNLRFWLTLPLFSVYRERMKNITVTLDDEIDRQARLKAVAMGTSVSAMVRRFLVQTTSGENDSERLKREERALREAISLFTAANRLSREEAHDRHALS